MPFCGGTPGGGGNPRPNGGPGRPDLSDGGPPDVSEVGVVGLGVVDLPSSELFLGAGVDDCELVLLCGLLICSFFCWFMPISTPFSFGGLRRIPFITGPFCNKDITFLHWLTSPLNEKYECNLANLFFYVCKSYSAELKITSSFFIFFGSGRGLLLSTGLLGRSRGDIEVL